MKKNFSFYACIVVLAIGLFANEWILDLGDFIYFTHHGYDEVAGVDMSWTFWILASILFVVMIFSIVYFIKTWKREKVIPVVEFNTPDGVTSADAGFVLDGTLEDRDISSLLIYWAGNGFLKVLAEPEAEKEDKKYKLVKLKDLPDTAKQYEKVIFNKMFENEITTLPVEDLAEKVGEEAAAASRLIIDENELTYFKPSRFYTRQIPFLLSMGVLLCTLLLQAMMFAVDFLPDIQFGVCIGFLVLGAVYYGLVDKSYFKNKRNLFWIRLIIILIFIGGAIPVLMFLTYEPFGWLVMLSLVVCLLTMILECFVEVRSHEGVQLLGSLVGLKTFIEVTEKDRIQALVMENPELFYKVLPLAYVLGVSDKWIKQFEVLDADVFSPNDKADMVVLSTFALSHALRMSMIGMHVSVNHRNNGRGGGFGGGGSYGGHSTSTFGGRGRHRG